MVGATTTTSRATGGTDSTSFNAAGPAGHRHSVRIRSSTQSHTWHTNLDTYERIVEDDVKAQAVVIAAVVYDLAMRDEMLPRFTNEQMPKAEPPAAPRDAGAAANGADHGRVSVTVIRSQPSHR